jgi:hypothetical protein
MDIFGNSEAGTAVERICGSATNADVVVRKVHAGGKFKATALVDTKISTSAAQQAIMPTG